MNARRFFPIGALFAAVTAFAGPDPAPPHTPTLSNAELEGRAASLQAQMETDSQHILHLQSVAKKQHDVIKLNCVNDRLVQLKAQRNAADEANSSLQAAITANSDDRQTVFARLSDIASNIQQLREQANACVGEPELYKQESGVEVSHPDFPDNPNEQNANFVTEIEPPGYASAFD